MATASLSSGASVGIDRNRLFWLSCISLIVTAMTFAIRAGILTQLSDEFALTDTQLGWVNSMAFLGFPLAMVVFGFLYNKLGPRLIMILAFVGHLLGLVLTIGADGFLGLLISTFFIGFANGTSIDSQSGARQPVAGVLRQHPGHQPARRAGQRRAAGAVQRGARGLGARHRVVAGRLAPDQHQPRSLDEADARRGRAVHRQHHVDHARRAQGRADRGRAAAVPVAGDPDRPVLGELRRDVDFGEADLQFRALRLWWGGSAES